MFNQLRVASTLGPAVNATMECPEMTPSERAHPQIPNSMASSCSQIGSWANSRATTAAYEQAQAQAQGQPHRQPNAHYPPRMMTNFDRRAQPHHQADQSPHHLSIARRPSQHNLPVPHPVRNAQAGPLSLHLAQAEVQAHAPAFPHSQNPQGRALAQMMVDRNYGVGYPLPPALSHMRNARHSGHGGLGDNGAWERDEGSGRYGYVPVLHGSQHECPPNEGSANRNRTTDRNGGRQPFPHSFDPHTRPQHHVTIDNPILQPILSPASPSRQHVQVIPSNPRISSPRQPIQANPPHPLINCFSASESYRPKTQDFERVKRSLLPSSRTTVSAPNPRVSTPTQRSSFAPVSQWSSPVPAHNHGTTPKRMLSTGTSQYAEGPPTKRPNSMPSGGIVPSLGHFASPAMPKPSGVTARTSSNRDHPLSPASSRQRVQPFNKYSTRPYDIGRYSNKDELPRKQLESILFPSRDTARETPAFPKVKAQQFTREHIHNDTTLGYNKPGEQTCDPFSGFSEESEYLNSNDLYKYLGLKLPGEEEEGAGPVTIGRIYGAHHEAKSKLGLRMLAKRFGVKLSKVDTGRGGVHLAAGDNVWLVPGRRFKHAGYPVPNDHTAVLGAEKEKKKENVRATRVGLTGLAVAPFVFRSTPSDRMVTLAELTTPKPSCKIDLARCTVDEDGGVHAPDLVPPTEQHAHLMWLLKSHEEGRA